MNILTNKWAYYNEFDPYAAQWLRNLIADGHIAPGEVDERSIEDVAPDDVRGFVQCHWFSGVGVWSFALRNAGWPDDRPIWTGSCPCQPFSAAGKGAGFADERHLWPAFHHLIAECQPAVVLGEQVASSAVDAWIDLVHADLEALGYAFGSVPFPSAGVGAPHIRDRNYWVANADNARLEGRKISSKRVAEFAVGAGGVAGRMEHADMPKPISDRASIGEQSVCVEHSTAGEVGGAGPVNGFWRDADWLGCSDGLWRPVESGAFPLADGIASRMDKLRAYGNAVNAQAAQVFIEAVMESL